MFQENSDIESLNQIYLLNDDEETENSTIVNNENSLDELEKQLSKFNKNQKQEEARTHSFLAKVNARITSQLESSDSISNQQSDNTETNYFVAADSDNRFILQKNSNYYFPDIDEG